MPNEKGPNPNRLMNATMVALATVLNPAEAAQAACQFKLPINTDTQKLTTQTYELPNGETCNSNAVKWEVTKSNAQDEVVGTANLVLAYIDNGDPMKPACGTKFIYDDNATPPLHKLEAKGQVQCDIDIKEKGVVTISTPVKTQEIQGLHSNLVVKRGAGGGFRQEI